MRTTTNARVGVGEDAGVSFPASGGARSTTATGRVILADAAAPADPGLAARIAGARDWRQDYIRHIRDLTAACVDDDGAPVAIAESGLSSMRRRMTFERDGEALPLAAALDAVHRPIPGTREIHGAGEPELELVVPYGGRELAGSDLLAQLDRWVQAAVVEPSFAEAVERVVHHPEWLSLPGRRIALVGAAAEIGPLEPLCRWGAHVIAIDLPDEGIWSRILELGRAGAGTLTFPVDGAGQPGIDVVRGLPELYAWLLDAAGVDELALGMYAYADGGAHVRVTAAVDELARRVLEARPATVLAYLATPTDAFVVPEDVVAHARRAYAERGLRRVAQAPLQLASRRRLFSPAYAAEVPVADALVPQQGPNYALAKRLQRWRGVLARASGHTVSFNVAPSSWTRSVTKNRVLAAAYKGARHFGVEIFSPYTARALMAALLVHDVHVPREKGRHPETLFSDAAAHGGLWRAAYEPRSALGLAALAGLPSALRR